MLERTSTYDHETWAGQYECSAAEATPSMTTTTLPHRYAVVVAETCKVFHGRTQLDRTCDDRPPLKDPEVFGQLAWPRPIPGFDHTPPETVDVARTRRSTASFG